MATGLSSNEMTMESDEVREMFCEQCDEHGVNVPASGYCVDCQDYMCDTCLLYHKRYMPEHTQLSADAMPQDFCLEKCDIHHKKVLKFYCKDCNGFACVTCERNSKRSCQFNHIPSLIQTNTEEIRKEIAELDETTMEMSKILDETKTQINENMSLVDILEQNARSAIKEGITDKKDDFKRQCEEAINSFDKRFDEIITMLLAERQGKLNCLSEQSKKFEKKIDDGMNTMEDKLKETVKADRAKLYTLMKDCMGISNDLGSLNSYLTAKRRSGRKSSLFVAAKYMKPIILKCQEKLDDVKASNTITYYDIDSKNVVLASQPIRLTYDMFTFDRIEKPKHANVSIISKPEINLHIDKSSSTYKSLCLVSENKLVVTNYKHSTMLLYSTIRENNKADILPLSANPWDVTKISAQRIAVTFPDTRVIQFLDPFVDNKNLKEIDVGHSCHGITNIGCNLIVSFINPVQIKVIDFDGVVKKILVNPTDGHSFISPLCLTTNCKISTIYISDYATDEISSMDLDGNVKTRYKDGQMSCPLHMVVDGAGTLYVCGNQSNNIIKLSQNLTNPTGLLDKSEVTRPVSVAFCTQRKRLYVAMKTQSVLKVYKVKEI